MGEQYLNYILVKDKSYHDYIKNNPTYTLDLFDNIQSIHPSWQDNEFKRKLKNGEFNNCVFGMMPSMVLSPEISYNYNGKTYSQNNMNLIFSGPGTGASLVVYQKPQ